MWSGTIGIRVDTTPIRRDHFPDTGPEASNSGPSPDISPDRESGYPAPTQPVRRWRPQAVGGSGSGNIRRTTAPRRTPSISADAASLWPASPARGFGCSGGRRGGYGEARAAAASPGYGCTEDSDRRLRRRLTRSWQAIRRQPNRVKFANRFTRAVAVGNPRGFTRPEKEGQGIAGTCSRLVGNSIVRWNHLHLSRQLGSHRTPRPERPCRE